MNDANFDFKVVNAAQHPDGSVTYEFEYSDEFKEFYEKQTGKELDQAGFQQFVDKVIAKNVEASLAKAADREELNKEAEKYQIDKKTLDEEKSAV